MPLRPPSRSRRWTFRGALVVLALGVGLAVGLPRDPGCGGAVDGGQCSALVETPLRASAPPSGPAHRLYLARGGATLTAGSDDAAHGVSSVVAGRGKASVTIPPAPLDDATWAEVVDCVRQGYARFHVEVTDQRPAEPGYVMALFGGTGDELGLPADVRGKSPLDESGCSTVEGAVVFVFSGKLGPQAAPHCEVAVHEIAHVFSVDHEVLAADVASYLPFSAARAFQDADALCGEQAPRACICGRPSQNSVDVLLDKLGPSPSADTTPPEVHAAARHTGPGYVEITVDAHDAEGTLAEVTLDYRDGGSFVSTTCGDGQVPCLVDGSSYTFTLAAARGTATWRAGAVDASGNARVTDEATLAVDDTPPDATPIALTVDASLAAGVAQTHAQIASPAGAITSATLYWTDARGVTATRALCKTGASDWTLPVTLATRTGARSFVVAASDEAGNVAYSPRTIVTP